MTQVIVLNEAKADLHAIGTYIGAENRRAAADMLRRLRGGFQRLAAHPEVGARRAGFGDERLRFLVVRHYSIVYTIEPDGLVLVARVLGPGRSLS